MLNTQLLTVMQREVDSQSLQLSPYCSQRIEQLVANGIQRMRNNNAADHPGRVMNAERNLKALIKYFARYSQEIGTYPNLKQADFDAALRNCPTFWPYCISG